jgi:hypothetical protein
MPLLLVSTEVTRVQGALLIMAVTCSHKSIAMTFNFSFG